MRPSNSKNPVPFLIVVLCLLFSAALTGFGLKPVLAANFYQLAQDLNVFLPLIVQNSSSGQPVPTPEPTPGPTPGPSSNDSALLYSVSVEGGGQTKYHLVYFNLENNTVGA